MTPEPEPTPSPKSYPQTFFEPPPGACQIILVRHGQSAAYVDGQPFPLADGQGDPPLSPLGAFQAQQVRDRLRHEQLSALYVTSLQRTHQTAAPLAEALGLVPRVEPDLREIHLGDGEGGRFRQMAADGHPAIVAMRAEREWGRVPGAETNQQLTDRTVAAVRRIAATHPDEVVAAFAHGGTIGALIAFAAGVNPFIFSGTRNGAIAHLVVSDDEWVIRAFNDAAHVGPLTADAEPPT